MPTNEEFKFYIVDVENQKVLFEENLKSNYSNLIKIDKKFINKNFIYLPQIIWVFQFICLKKMEIYLLSILIHHIRIFLIKTNMKL